METLARRVRIAARALAKAGLVHAYGHCSARLDADRFLVSPAVPLGMVVPSDACVEVPVTGPLPQGVLGEVRLHQHIYARRPEAGGVVRFMGPQVMALAAMCHVPRIRHGFGCYFASHIGFWDDVQLVRDDARAERAVMSMGEGRALMLRGNGAVVVGDSLEEAVGLAWYLEDTCRIEQMALSAGFRDAPAIVSEEAARRATRAGRLFERMWDFLTQGDIELPLKDQ